MSVRSRQRTSVVTGSRTEKFGGHVTNTRTYVALDERVDDVTDPGDNGPFTVTRTERSGGLINGVEKSNLTGYIWNNYPCAYMTDSYLISHLSVPNQPTDGTLAAQALARTEPYRPSLVALEYLSDLRDLGSLAHNEFQRRLSLLEKQFPRLRWSGLKRLAKLNLLYRFGILPLISDIETLGQFQNLVDKRVGELERLYGGRGLRRTLDLWDGSNHTIISNQTIQSQGVILHARLTKSTKVKVRAHVRWHAIFPVQKTDKELRSQARKAILGYGLNPYTFYELAPWSWLIDYFTNLGDIVKAGSNSFSVYHDAVRIMETKRTVCGSSNHDTDDQGTGYVITCTPFEGIYETKSRRLTTPTVIAQDAILTDSELSILGSLAVLRSL